MKPQFIAMAAMVILIFIKPLELKDSLISYGKVISPNNPGVGIIFILVSLAILIFYEELEGLLKKVKLNTNF